MSKRIEDTKEVIRGRKPKKDKQYNRQKQKDKTLTMILMISNIHDIYKKEKKV
jgi:hypothetical protein